MSKNRITNKEIHEMFQEGNLIARALHTEEIEDRDGGIGYNFQEFENEIRYLNTKRKDGNLKNVEREGQRNRSATLLVPEVNMDLFENIGLLYDADKSTIRAYMYHDSMTISSGNHDTFYNINVDKPKFEPIISKKEFLEKYKSYRKSTDNTKKEHVLYNEVLANFFPESIAGLVASNASPENKLRLLEAKYLLSKKYGLDLSMVIMDKGKIYTWNLPSLESRVKNSNFIKFIVF